MSLRIRSSLPSCKTWKVGRRSFPITCSFVVLKRLAMGVCVSASFHLVHYRFPLLLRYPFIPFLGYPPLCVPTMGVRPATVRAASEALTFESFQTSFTNNTCSPLVCCMLTAQCLPFCPVCRLIVHVLRVCEHALLARIHADIICLPLPSQIPSDG